MDQLKYERIISFILSFVDNQWRWSILRKELKKENTNGAILAAMILQRFRPKSLWNMSCEINCKILSIFLFQ